jgi:hypothetical protein
MGIIRSIGEKWDIDIHEKIISKGEKVRVKRVI